MVFTAQRSGKYRPIKLKAIIQLQGCDGKGCLKTGLGRLYCPCSQTELERARHRCHGN